MAARRRPRRLRRVRLTKRQLEAERKKRELTLSVGGQIAARILTNPNALRGVGMLLEVVGKAAQRAAEDVNKTTSQKPLPAADVLDLSDLRDRKKSDG